MSGGSAARGHNSSPVFPKTVTMPPRPQPLTPEGQYSDLFPPCPELLEVKGWKEEPLVAHPQDVLAATRPKGTPFELTLSKLLDVAKERGYLKAGGCRIFEPVDGIPCAFKRSTYKSYGHFVEDVVGREWHLQVRLLKMIVKQLQIHTRIEKFPEYKPTPGVWAFRDGVFDAKSMSFVTAGKIPDGVVAQHYFDIDFPTGDVTRMHPHFDKILSHQYGQYQGVTEMGYVLLGKTILPVMFKDKNVGFVYIYGIRGTGKSTFIRIINALVPNYWDIHDSQFRLSGLEGCSTGVSEDAGVRTLKAALPVNMLNRMCEGGKVSIKRKGQNTCQVENWSASVAIVSGSPPPWADDGVVRRMMPLFALNPVTAGDIDFETHIVPELPYILLHSLRAHQKYVDQYGHLASPPLPPQMTEWREYFCVSTRPVIPSL